MISFLKTRKQRLFFIKIFFLVLIPIALGLFVYFFLREKKPDIFSTYKIFTHIAFSCNELQIAVCKSYFLKYNFPDAAWTFALAAAVALLVEDELKTTRIIYMVVVFITFTTLEILQISYIRGTFDIFDLFWEIIAASIAVFIVRRIRDDKNAF